MNVYLLYPSKEWKRVQSYYDKESIINDLGLSILFHVASRNQEQKTDAVQTVADADEHLGEIVKKVMMVPLRTEEEIYYRQEIMQDFFRDEDFLKKMYDLSRDMMIRWEKLGKKEMDKPGSKNRSNTMISQVKMLHLYVNTLTEIKKLCREKKEQVTSRGLQQFFHSLEEDFGDEYEEKLRAVLADIAFFCDGAEEYSLLGSGNNQTRQARMVLDCQLANGMKLGSMRLEEVETLDRKLRKLRTRKTFLEKMTVTFASEPTTIIKDIMLLEDLKRLEEQVVKHIMSAYETFMGICRNFFEELYIQIAFYRGCYNLYVRSRNMALELCYPKVCPADCLEFENLTEFGMATYRSRVPVGNDSVIDGKMLLIVTGANQGGKSTFLRSLGIAQVMLQCGMFVSAKSFQSGIFPHFFTHFTRREDSAMNSGRLDEELGRIDDIIRHLGKNSIVLLNESFATTTEEEGSVIAYDIIKAMVEAGVKVLTVTHLLTFAKRVYKENRGDTTFLCAQRNADGSRTYKMIPNEPELTSFGLDLYDRIIPAKKETSFVAQKRGLK